MGKNIIPQVLLFGNGLLRSYSDSEDRSWGNLIKEFDKKKKISENTSLPFPLQIILATEDNVENSLKDNQEIFFKTTSKELKERISELLTLGFDDILTTNYSYEIEETALTVIAEKNIAGKKNALAKICRHTTAVKKAENKYLLHTYNDTCFQNITNKIWHIHGEARKPSSIIIGHYYYGNLFSRYKKHFDERKDAYRKGKITVDNYDSWLDAFILGDVYVLGFGFDLSEFDLWWLLNRKKRENLKEIGKVYFYEPRAKFNEEKQKVLDALDVKVENCNIVLSGIEDVDNELYKKFYDLAIKDISDKVRQKKGRI